MVNMHSMHPNTKKDRNHIAKVMKAEEVDISSCASNLRKSDSSGQSHKRHFCLKAPHTESPSRSELEGCVSANKAGSVVKHVEKLKQLQAPGAT